MSNNETQLATSESKQIKTPVLADAHGVQLRSLDDMWRFALCAVNSGIYKDLPTPEVAIIKIQAGLELGLSPVWALSNILVVHGRCSVWGDAMLGLVLARPDCEDVLETTEGEGDAMAAVCEVKRKGRAPVIRRFSVADAKKAGLWSKAGPWTQYGQRMLQMRARSWACRDAYADALRGLGVREEMESIEPRQVAARVVSTEMILPSEKPESEAAEFELETK